MTTPLRTISLSILAALCVGVTPTAAQAPANTREPAKTAKTAFHSECIAAAGFCVNLPATWKRVGDVYDDLGFVAADPHSGGDPSSWPQLTVIAFQPPQSTETASPSKPAPEADSAPPSLDVLVDRMLMPAGALASAQTLSRSRLLLNGAPAEIVQVQFPAKSGSAAAVEEVALIDGDDDFVYSVALRCAPQELERLEPVFQHAVQSWHIRQAAAAPSAKTPGSAKPSTTAPASPHAAQPRQDSARP